MTVPEVFTVDDLRQRGFEGFTSIADLRAGAAGPTRQPGVYVVVREDADAPSFLSASPASWFKGQDPSVPDGRLRNEWVEGAQLVYVGSGCNLAERVRLLIEFSDAGPQLSVFHWGGRLLWQLGGADRLLVAWKTEPAGESSTERDLVDEFRDVYGLMPFANLKRPPIRNC